MNNERELQLRWRDLTVSELIEVLQWQKDQFGDVKVFAHAYDGSPRPILGVNIFFYDGTLRIRP